MIISLNLQVQFKDMKRMIYLSTIVSALIGLITTMVISCNKNKIGSDNNLQTQKTDAGVSTTAVCNCGSKPSGICPTFKNCVKKFLGSADSRSFTINWTNCTACGNTLPPPTTGLICYTGQCGELYVQFDNLPSCLTCYKSPYCQKVTTISCEKGVYSIQFISLGPRGKYLQLPAIPIYLYNVHT